VQGNNKDFYRNQFMNLLQNDQNWQERATAAAIRRTEAAANPQAPIDYDALWGRMGLPEVQLAQQGADGEAYAWNRDPWLKPGITTNADFFQHYGGDPSKLTPTSEVGAQTNWSAAAGPDALANQLGAAAPSWANELNNVWNQAWTRSDLAPPPGGGPTAAPGYALPVAIK
jgi:hypothetical protein